MQGARLAQRHPDHLALGLFRRLADRFGHLARLAGAVPDPALAIADHNKCGEAEPPAAFHNLGDPVDADEFLDELVLFPVIPAAAAAVIPPVLSSHSTTVLSLESETGLARGFRQRLDPAVIDVAAAVEDHGVDFGLQRALRHQPANGFGGRYVGAISEACS